MYVSDLFKLCCIEAELSSSCSFFPHSLEARDSHVLNEITQDALAC